MIDYLSIVANNIMVFFYEQWASKPEKSDQFIIDFSDPNYEIVIGLFEIKRAIKQLKENDIIYAKELSQSRYEIHLFDKFYRLMG